MTVEIDPIAALEILPKRIEETTKTIQGMLIDASVLEAVEGHNPEQVANLRKSIAFHEAVLDTYKSRLDAIQNAANGTPVALDVNQPRAARRRRSGA